MEKTKETIFIWVAEIYALLCLFFSFLSWRFVDYGKPDTITLVFLFSGFGLSFLPFASKLSVLGVLQIERTLQKGVAEVKSVLLTGEVVRSLSGEKFFIDEEGRHKVDDRTGDFLKSRRGIFPIKDEEIKQYPLASAFDSVENAPLRITDKGAVFFILNGKKFYVSSWNIIIDLNRTPDKISEDELRKFPSAR